MVGNYVIDNTLDSFRDVTSIIPRGTRVIELPSSGFTNIVLSKIIDTVNSQPYAVIDHRGFICTCTLQPTGATPSTIAGSDVIIRGQVHRSKSWNGSYVFKTNHLNQLILELLVFRKTLMEIQ